MTDEIPDSPTPDRSPNETLLFSSRIGDEDVVKYLLEKYCDENDGLDINCKGQQKSNRGWTSLHLACYFGHSAIAELLVKYGADVNIVNDTGDTALHKVSYTGREQLVLLLLSSNADVFIRNSEGQTARDVCQNDDIKKLLKGAEEADVKKKNSMLLHASREGDIQKIEQLLKDDHPPDINCMDSLGNTALHCAAYRGKQEVAVLLLQNGINPSLKNERGQVAIDLASNVSMRQILGVQPVKSLQKTASRFEGLLLRKSRFLGWKKVWAVLEKGVMSFFTSRADSTTGTKRKGYKYLDGADVILDRNDDASFSVKFSNSVRQRFCVPRVAEQQIDRQKWVNAIIEHTEFSSYYLNQGLAESDPDDDDVMPLGTMQDKLQTAQAHQQLLEKHIESLKEAFDAAMKSINGVNSATFNTVPWCALPPRFENVIESSRKVSSSLSHCLTVFSQQEEIRLLHLKQQQERCRVLQDALHALAQEHHELEKSFVSPFHSPPHSPLYIDTDCDEFFDAFDGDYSSSNSNQDDTISNEDNTIGCETGTFASFSSSSEIDGMKKPLHSKWGRPTLPVPAFSSNDFSVWSILKQCFGKELSKITMPVVFNEPLSFLQRIVEYMEYSSLLEKANNCDDPVQRMELVAAFAVGSISANWDRLGKPFNPLLGETYEYVCEEEGFRIVTEQVSHHPPVTAFHADSPHFVFSGAIHPKLKLWARSVEIKPEGTVVLRLLKHNEVYTWTSPTCCVHNIIVGKLWMEQCGAMEIVCHTSGLSAELNFKPAGWYGKDLNCVEGFIVDKAKSKLKFIFGKWSSFLRSLDVEHYDDYLYLKDPKSQINGNTSKISSSYSNLSQSAKSRRRSSSENNIDENCGQAELYRKINELPSLSLLEVVQKPPYASEYYNFTLFAMALNEMKVGLEIGLAPTDSRLRPDIRKLEEGDVDGAAFEKNRLEEKQREARKIRKKDRSNWEPLWFESKPHPYAKEELWSFKGGYWDRNFDSCPDIF